MLPWAVGLLAGVLALGPALGRGYVLRYDMVFVPEPSLTTVLRGADGFPRAIPSDAVVAALSALVPGDVVQAAALLCVFTVGGAGAARLLSRPVGGAGHAASAAAGVAYVWNPFVAERLLLGQWAMLLGYAGLPWVVGAVVRLGSTGGVAGFAGLLRALIPAAVGGFSSVVLTALTAGPVALFPRARAAGAGGGSPRSPRAGAPEAGEGGEPPETSDPPVADGRSGKSVPSWVAGGPRGRVAVTGLLLLALLLVSLPWLLPSLASGAGTDPAGVAAFAARPDTPFGAVGSLFLLGGVWNSGAVPAGYGEPVTATLRLALCLVALAGWVWWLRRDRPGFGFGLSVAAGAGFGIALLGTTEPGRAVLAWLVGLWPGFGPLRDGQLYVAPLALVQALGFGAAVRWVARGGRPGRFEAGGDTASRGSAGVRGRSAWWLGVTVFAVFLPLMVLPGLVWGAGGRLVPVDYPREWLRARDAVAADDRPGAVLVLPWSAYRGLDWSGEPVVVLDPATKLFDRRTLWNDDLRVGVPDGGTVVVAGEDARAREVARALETDPATGLPDTGDPEDLAGLLGGLGVRYVMVSAPIDNEFLLRAPGVSAVVEGPGMSLFRVNDQHVKADKGRGTGLEVTGGLVTVGAIVWSVARSGSSLVLQRSGFRARPGARKEIPK
ncbi:hypothetical protein [Nocardiopsis sp. FIRDI 009]|uniref:hypothetical protein n=1 Tax=Nocardiopsis sp. FIRDI 009 TaxID=714197 RepID=UPI000E25C606|nr:hypothetical protein [Nocardiopsis sp. FIRDI 009]